MNRRNAIQSICGAVASLGAYVAGLLPSAAPTTVTYSRSYTIEEIESLGDPTLSMSSDIKPDATFQFAKLGINK